MAYGADLSDVGYREALHQTDTLGRVVPVVAILSEDELVALKADKSIKVYSVFLVCDKATVESRIGTQATYDLDLTPEQQAKSYLNIPGPGHIWNTGNPGIPMSDYYSIAVRTLLQFAELN